MPVFKRVETRKGTSMYYKDGDLVSPKNVPADILKAFEQGVAEIDTTPPEIRQMLDRPTEEEPQFKKPVKAAVRECIVCGDPATQEKFLHMQFIYLCRDDYLHRSTGEIAAAMREKGLI